MLSREIDFGSVDWIYVAQDCSWWASRCEHSNEPLNSVKGTIFSLNDHRLPKKECVP